MILDKCDETCGYAAAITAAICLGSFGVPVKSEVVTRLDVDPLVVQVRCALLHLNCLFWEIIYTYFVFYIIIHRCRVIRH